MCNLGTKEGVTVKTGRFSRVWSANETFFLIMRSESDPIGIAIDPLTAHKCGHQRYLAILWFDACLSARLSKTPSVKLKPMPKGVRRTMPHLTNITIWLPNKTIDEAWAHYTKDTQIPDQTPPPAPTNLQVKNQHLTWKSTADLESSLAHFIIMRDGLKIATVPEKPQPKFGRSVFQGLQYSDTPSQPLVQMKFTDTKPAADKEHKYQVIAVNTVVKQSLVFDRAYLGMAMCSPCRSELYTGLYPFRNGCAWNHGTVRPDTKSLPHHLKPLGYRVGLAGKVHVKPKSAFPFDRVPGFDPNCVRSPTQPHDLSGAKEFITRKSDQPFCLVVALTEPHAPWVMGDASAYPPAKLKLPSYLADTPLTRERFSAYLAEITYMDS